MSEPPRVGVLGARSLVGRFLVPLLAGRPGGVLAVSRGGRPAVDAAPGAAWCRPGATRSAGAADVPDWITLCPIWAVPEWLSWLEALGTRRLVALSSTAVVTKAASPDAAERKDVARLASAEAAVAAWADARGTAVTILRPTMIYDGTSDGSVTAIADCVRRFGWFPLCGVATGLRQPVHAGDVAAAAVAALGRDLPRRCYTLSGAEALPFRELAARACRGQGLPPRLASLPPWAWNALASLARALGIPRAPSAGMGRRMNEDLSCSHAEAAADFGFSPRPFGPDLRPAAAAAAAATEELPR